MGFEPDRQRELDQLVDHDTRAQMIRLLEAIDRDTSTIFAIHAQVPTITIDLDTLRELQGCALALRLELEQGKRQDIERQADIERRDRDDTAMGGGSR